MAVETVQDIVEQMADLLGVYGEQRSIYVSETVERINDAIDFERRMTDRDFHNRMIKIMKEAIRNEQHDNG